MRPSPSSTSNCFNNKLVKHITKLPLGLSQLRDRKFKYDVLDSLHPICSSVLDIEITCHYLHHCRNLTHQT